MRGIYKSEMKCSFSQYLKDFWGNNLARFNNIPKFDKVRRFDSAFN